ncbi:hypothetical protein JTE90_029633 [Oedothorax gibbosus]|uniref:MATH domain-containing protein n=1 Tax=Oedothorax gibbosus TaxID=931172 RepID=A0AAV6VG43_9ARAC|nr:hypothetical protein JTE90_029633 [Oedothorax gibbosus]
MASWNREGGVTLIWVVENFDINFYGKLVSPVFQSKSLDRTKWIISIYPKGPNHDGDSISLVLTRCCARNQEDHNKIILDCELAIIAEDGSSLVSMEIKKPWIHN